MSSAMSLPGDRHRASSAARRDRFKIMEPTIISALGKGYFRQVRYLVDLGADLNERDSERRTPLIHCAFVEDEAWGIGIARTLLEHGAMAGFRDCRGLNAFHYAVIYERLGLVRVYLSAVDFDLQQGDRLGNTALHYCVRSGNVPLTRAVIMSLVKYGKSVDKANLQGVSPLIQAYKSGHLAIAQILIEEGCANRELRDDREHKNGYEWEQIALAKQQAEADMASSTQTGRKYRSQLRRNRRVRAMSAPPTSSKSVEDSSSADFLVCKSKLSSKLYRPASSSNLRNQPEVILQVQGLEAYSDAACSCPLSVFSHRSMTPDLLYEMDWRGEIKQLISNFNFQFTESYRKSVNPKEPCSIMVEDLRPVSPALTESQSDTFSDMASVTSRRSCISRRSSTMKNQDKKKASSNLKGEYSAYRNAAQKFSGRPTKPT